MNVPWSIQPSTVIRQCVVINYGAVLHCMILMAPNWVSDYLYAVKFPRQAADHGKAVLNCGTSMILSSPRHQFISATCALAKIERGNVPDPIQLPIQLIRILSAD